MPTPALFKPAAHRFVRRHTVAHRLTSRSVLALVALVVLVAPFHAASAWGERGHSIVAELAQRRVSPATAKAIAQALGPNAALASVASWADDYRAAHRETANWHFVDIPVDESTYDPAKYCVPTAEGDCIVAELARVKHDLACGTPDVRRTALRFATHFVGDLHQPLHAVGDQMGGNGVLVVLDVGGATCTGNCRPTPVNTNLHAVWDAGLLDKMAYDWGALVDEIEALGASDAVAIAAGTPTDWALETHAVGQVVWAATPADRFIDEGYFARMRPVILERLRRGGIRLARFLDDAYAQKTCS